MRVKQDDLPEVEQEHNESVKINKKKKKHADMKTTKSNLDDKVTEKTVNSKKKSKKRKSATHEEIEEDTKKVKFSLPADPQETEKEGKDKEDEENNKKKQESGLAYLKLYTKHRAVWSFRKNQQTWLLKNIYNETMINAKHFKRLIKYIEGLKGGGRTRLLEEAQTHFDTAGTDNEDTDEVTLNRARQIMQIPPE